MSISRKQILLKFGGETIKAIISEISSKTPVGTVIKLAFGNTLIDSFDAWLNDFNYLDVKSIITDGVKRKKHFIRTDVEIVCASVEDCLSLDNGCESQNTISSGSFNIDSAVEDWSAPILKRGDYYEYEQDIKASLRYVIRVVVQQTVEEHLTDIILSAMKKINAVDNEQQRLKQFQSNLEALLHDLTSRVEHCEDEIHRLNSHHQFRYIVSQLQPFSSKGANRYHFSNDKMQDYIIGRRKELNQLTKFLRQENNFAYCVITGPGGIGKSKLIYSFMRQQEKLQEKDPTLSRWYMRFATKKTLEDLQKCENWDLNQDTLLVYDYAGETPELLQICINRIIDFEGSFNHKLRLVLLNQVGQFCYDNNCFHHKSRGKFRKGSSEISTEYPYWYERIIAPLDRSSFTSESHVLDFQSFFINLTRLQKRDYLSLIKKYAKRVHGVTLSQVQIDSVLRFSGKLTGDDSRPLFILVAVDAVLQQESENIDGWNIDDFLDFIYRRDILQWERDIPTGEVRLSLMDALTYATVFGEWNLDRDLVIAGRNVPDVITNALSMGSEQGKVKDWIKTHSAFVDTKLWPVTAYEPDAIGEYYALTQITALATSQKQWSKIIYSELEQTESFFHRSVLNSSITGISDKLQNLMLCIVDQLDDDSDHIAQMLMNFAMSAFIYGGAKEFASNLANKLLQKSPMLENELITTTMTTFKHFEAWSHSYRKKRFAHIEFVKVNCRADNSAYKIWIRMNGMLSSSEYRTGHHKLGEKYCSVLLNEKLQLCDTRPDEVTAWIVALKDVIYGQYYIGKKTNACLDALNDYVIQSCNSEIVECYIECYSLFFKNLKYHSTQEIIEYAEAFYEIVKKATASDTWQACYKTISLVLSADAANLLRYASELKETEFNNIQKIKKATDHCVELFKCKYQEYMEKWQTDFIAQSQFERGIRRIVSADSNAYTYFKGYM